MAVLQTAAAFQETFQAALLVVEDLQTEILVFVIALIAHTLVFGKHSVRKPKRAALSPKHSKVIQERPRPECAPKGGMKAPLVELKAAIDASNLDGALSILKSIATPWKASLGPATPSGAPRHVLRQLLRLAAEQSRAPFLMDELCRCDLMIPWTAEVLLDEASKLGCRRALDATRERVRAHGVRLSPAAFSTLLRGARTAAEASEALADAVQQRAASEDVLAAAAEAAAAHGDSALAGDAFGQLPARPSVELGAAVVLLIARGLVRGQGVLQFFEERLAGTDVLCEPASARCIAEAAIKAKRQDLLKELMAASTGSRQVGMLRSLGSAGQLKAAEELFKACPQKTACLHNALLDLYVDAREMVAAERMMTQAMKAGLADTATYNTMIKAHLRKGDIRRARSLIGSMCSAGLTPTCVTFNELIDAAFKSDPQAVWPLVDEMQACGRVPNQVTCSILLKNVHRSSTSSDVQRTLAILDAMGEGMDEVLLSSICEACIRSGQQDLLRQQLKRQREHGAVAVRGAHTFGSIIRAYGFVEDLEGIWDTWNEMRRCHVLPTSITLGCTVEALVCNDGPDAGYRMIEEMLGSPSTRTLVNAVIYCSVIKGFAHRKQFGRVWEIYGEMQTNMKALHFSPATYNLLIDCCARSCNMGRVPALLQEMSQQKIEPNVITFSTIVKGYCQENDLDKAFDLLDEMKTGRQFKPDEITYNTLLDGCARHGYYERGIAVFQDMQDSGVSPSNFTLSVLVKLANRSHQLEKAFDLCADVSKRYRFRLNVHVYNNLINACILHRDVKRALAVFEKLLEERVRPDGRTYTLLLRALLAEDDAAGAAGMLRAAFGLPGTCPAARKAERLPGGLPLDVVTQTLEGIARLEADRAPVAQLVGELRRLPGVRLDPRLVLRLTSPGSR